MQISATLPQAPQPQPQAGANARPADGGFAALLGRQAQTADAPDANSAPRTDAETPTAPRRTEERGGRARTPSRDAQATTRDSTVDATADPGAESDTADTQADAADPAALPDPSLAEWLAALHRPARAEATAGAPDANPRAASRDALVEAAPARARGARPAGTATPPGLAERGADAARAHDAVERAEARALRHAETSGDALRAASDLASEAAPLVVAATERAAPAASRAGATGIETLAALGTAPEPAAARTDVTVPAVAVPAAVDAPEFGQAFAVRVSLLARDGVQQAQLHLNPAEMGPVSVQIAVDGAQARIDFGAAAAPTREAIERSLPELAAALRDAGFTLAGGGVSPHAGGHAGQGDAQGKEAGAGTPRAGAAASGGTVEAPAPRWQGRVSAGGVDLYA